MREVPGPRDEQAHEDDLRDVERVMMYIAEAQRKAEEVGRDLAARGAERRILDALATAAAAMRVEHNRLLNRTHFVVPEEGPPQLPGAETRDEAADQQRMAI